MKKHLINFIVVSIPTIIITLLLFEFIFRYIIPASNPPTPIFENSTKIYKFDTVKREGLYTHGKFSELKATWHINNQGWNFPENYSTFRKRPLIAIIGDSYVEALQVDSKLNFSYKLKEKLKNNYDVYAFGRSGAPMSHYLYLNKYVDSVYNPDIVVINIVHNDFDDCLNLNSRTYFSKLHYDKFKDSFDQTIPISKELGKGRISFFLKSAIFRYLFFNLDVYNKFINYNKDNKVLYESNIDYESVLKQKQLIEKATDFMFRKFKEINKNKRLIFIIDGTRESIYNHKKSNVQWLNDMVVNLANKYEIEVVDLTPEMRIDFNKNHLKFNSDVDFHWNAHGHDLVSEVLYKKINK